MTDRLTRRDDTGRAVLTRYGMQMYCSTQATADCFAELEESIPRWVPVAERLPEEDSEYLVVFKLCGFIDDFKINEEEIKILRYHDGKWFPGCIPKWLNDTLKQEVTYWMPMPILPKEEIK